MIGISLAFDVRQRPATITAWHLCTVIIPRRTITGRLVRGQVWRRHDGRRCTKNLSVRQSASRPNWRRRAMAALEADARPAAEQERRIEAEKEQQRQAEGRKKPGKPAAPPSEEPDPKSQRNFTDPESRIMKSKDGFVQAYNAQAAVDAGAQIIVAHELTQCSNDQGQLVALIEAIESNLGRKPEQASADSGYCTSACFPVLEGRRDLAHEDRPGLTAPLGPGVRPDLIWLVRAFERAQKTLSNAADLT